MLKLNTQKRLRCFARRRKEPHRPRRWVVTSGRELGINEFTMEDQSKRDGLCIWNTFGFSKLMIKLLPWTTSSLSSFLRARAMSSSSADHTKMDSHHDFSMQLLFGLFKRGELGAEMMGKNWLIEWSAIETYEWK